jgi:hypothetical protein
MKEEIDINWIQTAHRITCTTCQTMSGVFEGDEHHAAKVFAERGWKTTKTKCYCPEHNKTKTK